MAKWKCEICGSGFDNFQAQGFDHQVYCPLCYFKELYKREKIKLILLLILFIINVALFFISYVGGK